LKIKGKTRLKKPGPFRERIKKEERKGSTSPRGLSEGRGLQFVKNDLKMDKKGVNVIGPNRHVSLKKSEALQWKKKTSFLRRKDQRRAEKGGASNRGSEVNRNTKRNGF